MAKRIPARLTAPEGRRFASTVGSAFLLLAAVAWWRGHPLVFPMLAALGGVLMVAGLALPTRLGPVQRGWMAMAHALSRVTTPIVMSVMYMGVITPVGLLRRTLARNPLHHAEGPQGFWKERSATARRSAMRRQF